MEKSNHIKNKKGLNSKVHLIVHEHGMPINFVATEVTRYPKTLDAFIVFIFVRYVFMLFKFSFYLYFLSCRHCLIKTAINLF